MQLPRGRPRIQRLRYPRVWRPGNDAMAQQAQRQNAPESHRL